MERKYTDKEFFMILVAWRRMNSGQYNSGDGWKKVDKILRSRRKRNIGYAAAAAIVILLLSFGYWRWYMADESEKVEIVQTIRRAEGLPVLVLANGTELVLDKQGVKQPIRQAGTLVMVNDSSLVLQYIRDSLPAEQQTQSFNTLRIPKGGEYSLTLADGSQVWLNSESTLRYPVSFAGECREVELEGEGYFEVVPDTLHPFYVRMGKKAVEVLGTHFNVSHYASDSVWHATLVEGKVKVHSGESSYILHPGAHYEENTITGRSAITNVDVQLYTSWKDGKVIFKDERLEDIVKKLARWYDFEIFYVNPSVKDLHFGGAINKYNSFEVVLRYLERTAGVRFDIRGKTVSASLAEHAI